MTGDQVNHSVEGLESVSRVKYSLSNHGHILAFSLKFNPIGYLKTIFLFPRLACPLGALSVRGSHEKEFFGGCYLKTTMQNSW